MKSKEVLNPFSIYIDGEGLSAPAEFNGNRRFVKFEAGKSEFMPFRIHRFISLIPPVYFNPGLSERRGLSQIHKENSTSRIRRRRTAWGCCEG